LKKLITNPNEAASSSASFSAPSQSLIQGNNMPEIEADTIDEVREPETTEVGPSPIDSSMSSPSFYELQDTPKVSILNSKDMDGKISGEEENKKSVANDLPSLTPFTVSTSSSRGKCLISSQVIKAGDMVLTEKALLNVLHPTNLDKYCYHCLKKVSSKYFQVFPCKSCTQIRFCSQNCSTTAHQEYHWVECGFLDLLTISKDFHYSPKLTLKVLAKYGITKCLSTSVPEDQSILDGYPGFLDMVEHEKQDTNDYSLASAIITSLLLEKTSNDIMLTKSSLTSLLERVVKHLRQVNVNAVTILAKEVVRNDEAEAVYTESTVGVGIYLTTRLINHSCDPNARIVRFDKDTLNLMAVREIASGEEITISYGGSYRWQIKSKRRAMLRDSYFFDCDCNACHDGLQPLTTALSCPDCNGPVTSDGAMTCLDCKKCDHIQVNSVIADTTACLKMIQLADTVIDPKNKEAASSSGINPHEIADKSLDEAFDTLSKIVYKTHNELFRIQEKKLVCCLRLKKYRKAVEVADFLVNGLRAQYHETYFKVINAILTLLKCQSLYYKQLKAASPLDKNEINIIKTYALKNTDLLEQVFLKISSGDDGLIRDRILANKRLFESQ